MNIAILRARTDDNELAYNAIEYTALMQGARLLAYVDPIGTGPFRGLPVVTPWGLTTLDVDLVVATVPLTPEHRRTFEDAGWPSERLMSFATHAPDCMARWQSGQTWLAARQPRMTGAKVDLNSRYVEMGDPVVHTVRPKLSPSQLMDITTRVVDACRRAVSDAPKSGPYAAGRGWAEFLRQSRPRFYDALRRNDLTALNGLLASCLRNEMTTGTLGGAKAFEAYDSWVSAGRAVQVGMRQQFNVWRYSVSNADVTRLASPPVGNPYGSRVGQDLVHPNTFLNDYRAEYLRGMLEDVDRPVVVDLGGGFGGFGHQLVARQPRPVYVDFDLPENLIVASYFLMAAHPDKRVLLYESKDQVLDAETLRGYDIVLMPNFMLPWMAERSADVFTNFISLSEMDYANIEEYLRQVDRVCGGFLYHENLLDNGGNYEFYPVSVFPELENFKRISSTPSRWPFFSPTSAHHCHAECLYVRRDIDQSRYLAAPQSEWAGAARRHVA